MKNVNGTAIAWPLRTWLAVEVGFGVAAVTSIGIDPANSKTNFAWPIQPVVMAAVLGAFYLTTAPLFVLPLFAKRWEMIRAMMLPAAIFTAVQLAVTFLHWEKFSHGSTPFWVWYASYLLPPPILFAAYLWQQRAAGASAPPSDPMASGLRRILIVFGVVLSGVGTLFLIAPTILVPHFAWKLTPLTTRSLSGWLILYGAVLLAMARENDRTRCRLVTPMLILALPALLVQMSRFSSEVAWGNAALWLGLTLFAVVFGCGVALARGSWRDALR